MGRSFPFTGYVLDSSGFGLATFRVAGALRFSSRFQQRDEGVPRRPGGPPYLGCCLSNYLSHARTQLGHFYFAGIEHARYVLDSDNYYSSSRGRAGPLAGAGRLRPAAGSGTKAPMRQPNETLPDRIRLSQAHTRLGHCYFALTTQFVRLTLTQT